MKVNNVVVTTLADFLAPDGQEKSSMFFVDIFNTLRPRQNI